MNTIRLALTIGVLLVAITTSHVRLEGRLDTLSQVNAVEHAHIKQHLQTMETRISGTAKIDGASRTH